MKLLLSLGLIVLLSSCSWLTELHYVPRRALGLHPNEFDSVGVHTTYHNGWLYIYDKDGYVGKAYVKSKKNIIK